MGNVVMEKSEAYWRKSNLIRKIDIVLQVLFGLPKSVIFNLYYFGVRGLKLPVLLSNKVKIKKLKGAVVLNAPCRVGMIKLGFTAPEMYDNSKLSFVWVNDGVIEFNGNASFSNGVAVRVYGHLIVGKNFRMSSPAKLICYKKISFGEDVLIGWDCEITDGDAHKIYNLMDCKCGNRLNENKEIEIGDRVWLAAGVKVFKGVIIKNDTVVASRTVLTKSIEHSNCIIGGNPNRILRKNIVWKE